MNYCQICGKEIEKGPLICPTCEERLLADKDLEKRKKPKNLKIIIWVVFYIIFLGFLISFIIISVSCYKSNNINCYKTSLVLMIHCFCSCFIVSLLGEEIPKWKFPSKSK